MHIAWITTGFVKNENDYGGIASIYNLAKELSLFNDIELTIFSMYYPAGGSEYKFYNSVVIPLREKGELSLKISKLDKLKAWIHCIRKFKSRNAQKKFDIIHSIWSGESGYVASYISRKHGIPLITSICGGEAAEIPEINYGSRLKFFQKKFVNKAFKNAKVIVSGSDYITGKIQSYYSTSIAAKTRKIPFGVDEKMFYPFKTEAENKSGIKLINIATAFPVKAHKDLFRALKIVIEKYPDTILECYGSDEKNILKDIVNALGLNNNVKLNGLIDYEKVPSALNDAHIFVLSSLYESQNLAMLEAAFCGLPVVSTDVGIAPEITPHIVTPGDYKALAEKILHVIVNYSEEKKRALGKTEEIRNRFSSRTSAIKFHELYTLVCSKKIN